LMRQGVQKRYIRLMHVEGRDERGYFSRNA